MQPHHDRHDDAQLRGLLREWKAPETPPSLEQRVLLSRANESWWRFLFSGYIRVPVSVACALALLLTVAVWKVAVQPPAPCVTTQTVAPALPLNGCRRPAPGVC